MSPLGSFRAIHCGGPLFIDRKAVTALCLLFERVFLPGNIELITEFAKTYEFTSSIKTMVEKNMANAVKTPVVKAVRVRIDSPDQDPIKNLTPRQRSTAEDYLVGYVLFIMHYRELFEDVLETDIVSNPKKLEWTNEPSEKGKIAFSVSCFNSSSAEDDAIPSLLNAGYVPVAVNGGTMKQERRRTAREVATLLAMRSVQMAFPAFGTAEPAEILEARERLRDHLPPFWASMLRLSSELSKRIDENISPQELIRAADELVDTVVRPSAIELKTKIEKERNSWLKKIVGPATEGLKLLFGRPGLTQQDFLTAAMLMGANITSAALEQVRNISSLRSDSGLTYLLELEKTVNK